MNRQNGKKPRSSEKKAGSRIYRALWKFVPGGGPVRIGMPQRRVRLEPDAVLSASVQKHRANAEFI